jgi:ABC-type lipoprotein export system ATPase subunit
VTTNLTPVLQLEGVDKTYRRVVEQVHVLVDFDFTLGAGEFVVVTGSHTGEERRL